jgi:hypothetical protein
MSTNNAETVQHGDRSVILPFAGTRHTASEREIAAISRVREISRLAKATS